MKKVFSIFLVLFFAFFVSFGQKFEEQKPFYANGALYQTKSNIINIIQFKGDSASYDNVKEKSVKKNPNLFKINSSKGVLQNKFVTHGTLLGSQSIIVASPASEKYYLGIRNSYNFYDKNNVKICDSSGLKSYRIVEGDDKGNFNLIQNLKVDCSISIAYSSKETCLYILAYYIKAYDTLAYGVNTFKNNSSTLIKLSTSGVLEKTWLVDSIFDNISILDEGVLLRANSISKTNFTYTVNGTNYLRNNSTDKYLLDLPLAILNPALNKITAHSIIKCSGGGQIFSDNKQIVGQFSYRDSISFNGNFIKRFADFQTHPMLVKFGINLDTLWAKSFYAHITINNFMFQESKIDFVLKTNNYLNNSYDNKPLSGLGYNNRIQLDGSGNLLRNYILVLDSKALSIKLSENSNRYFMNLIFSDSIRVSDKVYYTLLGQSSYLFITYNEDSLSTKIINAANIDATELTLFPNPTINKLNLRFP